MPAAEQEAAPTKSDHDKLEWKLKGHILRERARKKQEREQEVAEERLRKEREAREQQDVMTLGETREQISQLEAKLAQLKDEKHQLFLQLKKVLNEDDNRRKQIIKDTAEIILLDSSMPANMVHPQLYIQQQQQQQQPPPQQRPPLQQPQAPPPQQPTRLGPINQVPPQTAFKPATPKRGRSPSPPPSQVPVSLYHSYGYKTAPQPQVVTSQYQGSPQPKDDGRRNELVRAVLWNKPPHQYSNQPSAFYPVAPQELSIYYPLPTREPTRNVYEPPRPQAFHMEQKLPDHYALRTPVSHGHVIHPGSMPINQQAPPKGGSITAGYPVRSQLQYQQQPAPQAPTPLYTGQTRPLYQSSGQPLPYPPRD